ncbi:hypothetical protein Y032_0012g1664 [Ancylostoma ceylanicum]|uniref:Uncharacterized protein n=1 Tax=Ancylostoma ceylanicum TaxID=53326 RepID=A0A016VCD2_9BILA|nr:hypothetical protein Y032_0012g1664 [Ancylostoma ceylanicum]
MEGCVSGGAIVEKTPVEGSASNKLWWKQHGTGPPCPKSRVNVRTLHIAAKELCELKASSVRSDGNLDEDDFDITLEDDDDDGSLKTGPSRAKKELVTSVIKIEDTASVATENGKALNPEAAALNQKMDRVEQMMRELLNSRSF